MSAVQADAVPYFNEESQCPTAETLSEAANAPEIDLTHYFRRSEIPSHDLVHRAGFGFIEGYAPARISNNLPASGMRGAGTMSLVTWNDALSEGIGRSGTRYRLSYERLAGETVRRPWRIEADNALICAAETAGQAVRHVEALEALRCMARGLNSQLSDAQLQSAGAVAREMMEAAQTELRGAEGATQDELSRSARSLRLLADAIRQESVRRQRDDEISSLPLPN